MLDSPLYGSASGYDVVEDADGMVALYIYYRGLTRTPVHISTIMELTFPFIAILIDMKLYGTVLSTTQWLAAFVLVYSIYQIARLKETQVI
jgi:drug/metabolite transporter (DMT)-like permease